MPSPQQPIGSAFDAASTAADVVRGIDLSGKVAIVTGGHSGIGLETTRALCSAGATVVVPVRSPERARTALDGIDGVEIDRLDLADPASVDRFAEGFVASGRPVHMLINNAGIQGVPLSRDARGCEAHFATNHLGHFQLTTRLWPALRRAGGARVVNVSAWINRIAPLVFDDIHFERRDYDGLQAYGQSKTANCLFSVALDEHGAGEGIRAFALHPGLIVGTNLSPWMTQEQLRSMGLIDEHSAPVIDPESDRKTPQQGASTTVWCATSPQLDDMGGVYCENNEVSPLVSPSPEDAALMTGRTQTPPGVVQHSIDPHAAARLWELSEQLTDTKI
ncbi:SDR family NAD(P)-dependent oxidoreductase [Amycolatopsis sp. NPDC049253]|uniref:SDR family NAD(P)-dependent oxidoreductase n=1 Tax=Amycolatopsis sp. NPDC049253 TaxID=3155274 RepID=UPI00341CFC09